MSNLVKLNISNNNISIMSNSENADFQGDVSATVDGDGLTIAFNLRYLIMAINHMDTDECILNFTSPVAPTIVTPRVENNSDMHLILPVRVFN